MKTLPEHPGHSNHRTRDASGQLSIKKKIGSILGIIYFDSDWTPHFGKISMDDIPLMDKMSGNEIFTMLHYGLYPVYQTLGLKWEVPEDRFADIVMGKKLREAVSTVHAEKRNISTQDDPEEGRLAFGCIMYVMLFISIVFFVGNLLIFIEDINDAYANVDLYHFQKILRVSLSPVMPIATLSFSTFGIMTFINSNNRNNFWRGCLPVAILFFVLNLGYFVIYYFLLQKTQVPSDDIPVVLAISSSLCLVISLLGVFLAAWLPKHAHKQ